MIPEWSRSLRKHREACGLSRPALAARAGVSASAVKSFESGRRRPKEATLNALIDALGLTREEANPIRSSAGIAEDWYGVLHSRYPSDALDLAAEVEKLHWPVFVTNQAIDVTHANRAFQQVMGVDLSREFLGPGERNFLAQASTPRFAGRFDNYDELVIYMIGLVKGDPRWHQTPARPSPWLQDAVQKFMAGDQELVTRVLQLWQEAPPLPHSTRHIYRVRLRCDNAILTFQGSTSIADLWSELSWNEWVPDDEGTWRALRELTGA